MHLVVQRAWDPVLRSLLFEAINQVVCVFSTSLHLLKIFLGGGQRSFRTPIFLSLLSDCLSALICCEEGLADCLLRVVCLG